MSQLVVNSSQAADVVDGDQAYPFVKLGIQPLATWMYVLVLALDEVIANRARWSGADRRVRPIHTARQIVTQAEKTHSRLMLAKA